MLLLSQVGAANVLLLGLQGFCVLCSLVLGWHGYKGVRGIPDHEGKLTNRPTTIAVLVMAVGILIFAFTLLPVWAS
jgi:hypothetical protein